MTQKATASQWTLELGANLLPDGTTRFRVWAPKARGLELEILSGAKARIEMPDEGDGYFAACLPAPAGALYRYLLDRDKPRPDPVSRFLPEGLHGPTAVVDPLAFHWQDEDWQGLPLAECIFYELHVGTFTREGTFAAATEKIPYLKNLGVTCIELMPVAQFPGCRNWGYDGAGLYAVQNSYGGPNGLKRFVEACHLQGIGVCLDVVYNHVGPEGNYLQDFGYYFTDKYVTPWGRALNYDDRECDPVRRFIIQNALYWLSEYRLDGLRLDAIHGIFDFGAKHILEALQEHIEQLAANTGRELFLVAESDLNDTRILRPRSHGGFQLAGQWSDDFHHSVHACLTGERNGYYQDFGRLAQLADALEKAYVFDGGFSSFRQRNHGNSTDGLNTSQFVVCTQNHDQVGNRAEGDRHAATLSFEKQKIAAVLLLCSPYTPLLFMGQEYGAENPFPYFIDHSDPKLVEAVREGRKKEFAAFGWAEPMDPYAEETFEKAVLVWQDLETDSKRRMLRLHRDLIRLRKENVLPTNIGGGNIQTTVHEGQWLLAEFPGRNSRTLNLFCSLNPGPHRFTSPLKAKATRVLLDTEWDIYGGRAAARSEQTLCDEIEPDTAKAVIFL